MNACRRTLLANMLLLPYFLFTQSAFAQERLWPFDHEKLLADLQGVEWGDDWTYSVGGSLRYRFLHEKNRLRPPLAAGASDYQQWRFTPHFELKYRDDVTLFIEAIDASTFGEDLPEVATDTNRTDLLQYYVDFNLIDFDDDKSLHFKFGRQLLQYGSQHLISPLAWGNTFRNFEGGKLYYTSKDWEIDAFLVQPVHEPSGAVQPNSFDHPDHSKSFAGVYSSYNGIENSKVELYWLWLREKADRLDRIDGNRHTIGARYAGKSPFESCVGQTVFGWDTEAAYQFGTEDFGAVTNEEIRAGFVSLNGGMTFNDVTWKPNVSGIFWWGSGDHSPGNGTNNTVSSLFPLGHAYWGQLDNFNGSNLLDYGLHLTVNPTDKLSVLTGWHWFDKAANNDGIYNIAGAPFGGVTTTPANLGNELDLIATYQVNETLALQAGYSHFWYGRAVTSNPHPLVASRGNANQFYFFSEWTF